MQIFSNKIDFIFPKISDDYKSVSNITSGFHRKMIPCMDNCCFEDSYYEDLTNVNVTSYKPY